MTDSAKAEAEPKKSKRRQVGRSPAYPYLDLAKALERAAELRVAEGNYEAPVTAAYDAWDLGHKSSGARLTVAALRYYGLIDVNGSGDSRRIKVSDLAARILMDERDDQTERNKLIREAALNPKIHSHLMLKYPEGLPSDSNVKHHLIFDKGFNEKSSEEVLKAFKATATFARLYEPEESLDKTPPKSDDSDDDNEPPTVTEGDKVQWTKQEFKSPATVLGLSDDGKWVFTNEGDAAIPVEEIIVIEKYESPEGGGGGTPPPIPEHILAMREAAKSRGGLGAVPEGSREDKASLDEGEVVLRWPETLSPESVEDFEYWVNGIIKRAKRRAGLDS